MMMTTNHYFSIAHFMLGRGKVCFVYKGEKVSNNTTPRALYTRRNFFMTSLEWLRWTRMDLPVKSLFSPPRITFYSENKNWTVGSGFGVDFVSSHGI